MRLRVDLTKEAKETMGAIAQEHLTEAVSNGCTLLGTIRVDLDAGFAPMVAYIVRRPKKPAETSQVVERKEP